MVFNLFGPPSTEDIRVGYIDPNLGYVEGVTICQANEYASKNPGTTFIFRNGNNVIQYLNINEVNNLGPVDLISTDKCEGINQKKVCGPPIIQFFGGGGIGAAGNPIVGRDGALLAVDVVRGGNGYQYSPLVAAKDNCNYGSGATLIAVLGEVSETTESYENESDFEDYELCDPNEVGYGRIYGPNGEDLGPWEPDLYTNPSEDPIREQIEEYEDSIRRLSRTPFWSTRNSKPTKITCSDARINPSKYDVTFPAWSEFMNSYAISPTSPSNVRGSDFSGKLFTFEWTENFPVEGEYIFRGLCDNKAQLYLDNIKITDLGGFNSPATPITKTINKGNHNIRVDLINIPFLEIKEFSQTNVEEVEFTIFSSDRSGFDSLSIAFISEDKSHSFVIKANTKNNSSRKEKIKVRTNTNYKVISSSSLSKIEQGTLINNKEGGLNASSKIFADRIGTNNDNDDMQVVVNTGIFTPKNKKSVDGGRSTYDLTFRLESTSTSSGLNVKKVFNTLDYIGKADRTLWRVNPTSSVGDSLIHRCGISPFDTSTKEAQTDDFAGVHRIRWESVNFPVDGSYRIRMAVDDNVTLYIGNASSGGKIDDGSGLKKNETIIRYNGFISKEKANKEFDETRFFKAGSYRIRAELEQIKGKPLAKGNPMAIAIDIETTTATETIISPKSWNENPMGIALTIDGPEPTVPQEPLPVQEGRCPPNPIWTTRFPGAKESWFPVKYNVPNTWSKFMNRYAVSPVKPLDTPGSDSSGSTFSNSWDIDIPYDGFYGVKGNRDNRGRLLIDGKEVSQLSGFNDETPDITKVFVTKGRHTIGVEVYNRPELSNTAINQKIFRTKDWQTSSTQEFVDVSFIVYGEGGNTEKINFNFISEDGSHSFNVKGVSKSKTSRTDTIKIKPGLKYKVIASTSKKNAKVEQGTIKNGKKNKEGGLDESNKIFADHLESANDNDDMQIEVNLGIFKPSNKRTKDGRTTFDLTYKLDSSNAIPASGQIASGTTKNGVTYVGPTLFSYKDNRWGIFMNNHSVSPYLPPLEFENEAIVGNKTYTWNDVIFPESGQYDIAFQADNDATLLIGGTKVLESQGFIDEPQIFKVNISQGKYDVVIECDNIPDIKNIFVKNPVGFGVVISKNINLSSAETTSWSQNPIGISAILIPPPCPRKIRGKGVVTDVLVNDPGNGYLNPIPSTESYPVSLRLKDVIVENPGINYNCGIDKVEITPSNGAELDYECDTFGRIVNVKVLNPGLGFTEYPIIRMVSPPDSPTGPTGINASFRPVFEVVRDPIVIPEKLIQVTDLVGLKQTGYINGRPYYGAVYYENGVRYAGFYETVGDPVRVYDTLQESITGEVTTPPSAIERSGTDITSNDPRLNIPGTPENLI